MGANSLDFDSLSAWASLIGDLLAVIGDNMESQNVKGMSKKKAKELADQANQLDILGDKIVVIADILAILALKQAANTSNIAP